MVNYTHAQFLGMICYKKVEEDQRRYSGSYRCLVISNKNLQPKKKKRKRKKSSNYFLLTKDELLISEKSHPSNLKSLRTKAYLKINNKTLSLSHA